MLKQQQLAQKQQEPQSASPPSAEAAAEVECGGPLEIVASESIASESIASEIIESVASESFESVAYESTESVASEIVASEIVASEIVAPEIVVSEDFALASVEPKSVASGRLRSSQKSKCGPNQNKSQPVSPKARVACACTRMRREQEDPVATNLVAAKGSRLRPPAKPPDRSLVTTRCQG